MGITYLKMYLLVLCGISSSFIVVTSAPIDKDQEDFMYDHFNDDLGNSRFNYELPDGTINTQNINTINLGKENLLIAMGKYSYRVQGPIITSVEYVADDNGYRPRVSIYNIALLRLEIPQNAIITLQGGIG